MSFPHVHLHGSTNTYVLSVCQKPETFTRFPPGCRRSIDFNMVLNTSCLEFVKKKNEQEKPGRLGKLLAWDCKSRVYASGRTDGEALIDLHYNVLMSSGHLRWPDWHLFICNGSPSHNYVFHIDGIMMRWELHRRVEIVSHREASELEGSGGSCTFRVEIRRSKYSILPPAKKFPGSQSQWHGNSQIHSPDTPAYLTLRSNLFPEFTSLKTIIFKKYHYEGLTEGDLSRLWEWFSQ